MSDVEDELEAQLLKSPPFSHYQPPIIPGISNDLELDQAVAQYPPPTKEVSKESDEEDPSAAFFANSQYERDNDDVPLSIRFQQRIPKRVPRYVGIVKELALNAPKINSHVIIKDDEIITGWKDVSDLDSFLSSLYNYHTGKGYFCIVSNQLTTLLVILFIVVFSIFLFYCIDYGLIKHPTSKHLLQDVLYDSCGSQLPWLMKIVFFFFIVWWIWNLIRFNVHISKLREIREFYENVLNIKDEEINNIGWADVSAKITKTFNEYLRNSNDQRVRLLDAHVIANRIMRKENYMIALFNKDILDLSFPILFGKQQVLTKLLEWALSYCILSFVFKENGQINKRFLKERNSSSLTLGLKRRFMTMGLILFLLTPFLFVFLLLYFFFRYAQEYHKNPSSLGTRQYTPFARWKFREFNELSHYFDQRLNRSYPKAVEYLNQFPNFHLIIYAKYDLSFKFRFFSFITGSFAAVLLIATILNQDLLHDFEITPGFSSFFYITIFGATAAGLSGVIPTETEVYEPEKIGKELVDETHYYPEEWHDKLHTSAVQKQFAALFQNKIVLFFLELLSVLIAPYILLFSLPGCASRIIDFFREFSLHVESLGYVCSFAVFDFKRHGNVAYGAHTDALDDYKTSKGGKMEASFLSFRAQNPTWSPDSDGSNYFAHVVSRQRPLSGNEPGESMMASEWSAPAAENLGIGRQLFRLLDAVYETNRGII